MCFDTNFVKFLISGDTGEEGAYRWDQKNVAERSVCQHASAESWPPGRPRPKEMEGQATSVRLEQF